MLQLPQKSQSSLDVIQTGFLYANSQLKFVIFYALIYSGINLLLPFLSLNLSPHDYISITYLWKGLIIPIIIYFFSKNLTQKLYPNESSFSDNNVGLLFKTYVGMVLYHLYSILGLICLIIPGIIIWVRYFAVPYLIVSQNMGIIEAFKESKKIEKGHGWFVLRTLMILPFCVAIIIIGITAAFKIFNISQSVTNVVIALIEAFEVIYVLGINYACMEALKFRFIEQENTSNHK